MFATLWSLLKQTFQEWSEDGVPRLGAALAYYSVFSLGPLLIIVIGVAGLLFESSSVQQQMMDQIRSLVGDQAAETISALLSGASTGNQSLIATIFGVAVLLFTAMSVVVQLKDALNIIWDVQDKPNSGFWGYVRTYGISFAAVLGLGFLFAISLVSSALISAFGQVLFGGLGGTLFQIADFVLNFFILTLLFALMFKYFPDITISWHDVWVGAFLTAVLFNLGRFGIGLYLAYGGLESTYGAATSFMLLLLWIYYSAQIVFFGAEFTQVYARRYGSHSAYAGKSKERYAHKAEVSAASVSFAVAAGMVLGALLARN